MLSWLICLGMVMLRCCWIFRCIGRFLLISIFVFVRFCVVWWW